MAFGENTIELWKNEEYRQHMSDVHRKHIVPNEKLVVKIHICGKAD